MYTVYTCTTQNRFAVNITRALCTHALYTLVVILILLINHWTWCMPHIHTLAKCTSKSQSKKKEARSVWSSLTCVSIWICIIGCLHSTFSQKRKNFEKYMQVTLFGPKCQIEENPNPAENTKFATKRLFR